MWQEEVWIGLDGLQQQEATPTEPDPTATAMHGFIDKMIESLNKKKSEIRQLDATLYGLSDTPQKSNCTP